MESTTEKQVMALKRLARDPGLSQEIFGEVEGEEDSSPLPRRFNIEHLIQDSNALLRHIRPEDLDVDKNKGLRDAFKMIYDWYKQREKYTDVKKGSGKGFDYRPKQSGIYEQKITEYDEKLLSKVEMRVLTEFLD